MGQHNATINAHLIVYAGLRRRPAASMINASILTLLFGRRGHLHYIFFTYVLIRDDFYRDDCFGLRLFDSYLFVWRLVSCSSTATDARKKADGIEFINVLNQRAYQTRAFAYDCAMHLLSLMLAMKMLLFIITRSQQALDDLLLRTRFVDHSTFTSRPNKQHCSAGLITHFVLTLSAICLCLATIGFSFFSMTLGKTLGSTTEVHRHQPLNAMNEGDYES